MKSTKLRQSARGESCTFQIPGVCNHDPETVVLCHAPHPDKGMGYKSHPASELWAAYGCSACHDEVDGRTNNFFEEIPGFGPASKSTIKAAMWCVAIRDTQRRMVAKGLLRAD